MFEWFLKNDPRLARRGSHGKMGGVVGGGWKATMMMLWRKAIKYIVGIQYLLLEGLEVMGML